MNRETLKKSLQSIENRDPFAILQISPYSTQKVITKAIHNTLALYDLEYLDDSSDLTAQRYVKQICNIIKETGEKLSNDESRLQSIRDYLKKRHREQRPDHVRTGKSFSERAWKSFLDGLFFMTEGEIRKAVHCFRKAVEWQPEKPIFHSTIAHALGLLPNAGSREAIHKRVAHLITALYYEPHNQEIQLQLAIVYRQSHEDQKAAQLIVQVLAANPQYPEALREANLLKRRLAAEETKKEQSGKKILDFFRNKKEDFSAERRGGERRVREDRRVHQDFIEHPDRRNKQRRQIVRRFEDLPYEMRHITTRQLARYV